MHGGMIQTAYSSQEGVSKHSEARVSNQARAAGINHRWRKGQMPDHEKKNILNVAN